MTGKEQISNFSTSELIFFLSTSGTSIEGVHEFLAPIEGVFFFFFFITSPWLFGLRRVTRDFITLLLKLKLYRQPSNTT